MPNIFESFFNTIFGSIMVKSPLWGIVIVSFILTFIITIVYKLLTDQEKLKQVREDLKNIRKEMKDHKGNQEKLMELNKRSLEKSLEQFRHTLKPMLINFIPVILIFGWLSNTIPNSQVILTFPFSIPKIGSNEGLGWLGIYLISSIIFSSILRKLLKVS